MFYGRKKVGINLLIHVLRGIVGNNITLSKHVKIKGSIYVSILLV